MSAGKYNIEIEQGAYFERIFLVKDALEEIRDLDGYTARLSIRRRIEDAVPMLVLTTENHGITLGGPDGTIQVVMTSTETEELTSEGVYDLELIDEFGEVERLLQGKARFSREVTR